MKYSQPHITFYWEAIFFSWGGKILRKVESLMMILFSASLDSLSPTSYVGSTILLCIYLTNTFNNNSGTNCGHTWLSIDILDNNLLLGTEQPDDVVKPNCKDIFWPVDWFLNAPTSLEC